MKNNIHSCFQYVLVLLSALNSAWTSKLNAAEDTGPRDSGFHIYDVSPDGKFCSAVVEKSDLLIFDISTPQATEVRRVNLKTVAPNVRGLLRAQFARDGRIFCQAIATGRTNGTDLPFNLEMFYLGINNNSFMVELSLPNGLVSDVVPSLNAVIVNKKGTFAISKFDPIEKTWAHVIEGTRLCTGCIATPNMHSVVVLNIHNTGAPSQERLSIYERVTNGYRKSFDIDLNLHGPDLVFLSPDGSYAGIRSAGTLALIDLKQRKIVTTIKDRDIVNVGARFLLWLDARRFVVRPNTMRRNSFKRFETVVEAKEFKIADNDITQQHIYPIARLDPKRRKEALGQGRYTDVFGADGKLFRVDCSPDGFAITNLISGKLKSAYHK